MNAIRQFAQRLAAWMDDLLFPENVTCLCCDKALDADDVQGICKGCMRALDTLSDKQQVPQKIALPEGLDGIHSAMVYEAQARRLIHLLKYHSVRAAAVPLARRMALLPSGEEEIIVPVPTDKQRQRRRGFNQATLLAQEIGRELGMEVVCALVRVRRCRPQTGLNAHERMRNLEGCMRADARVFGRRVLLIDDVYTTGATAKEAARALLSAGAKSVRIFTAARAQADSDADEALFAPRIRR